jgi:Ca-activated chloride channel homolog
MRCLLLILLLTCAATARANNFWDRLWLTPDQHGEQLLRRGDLDAAAQTFRDPRRKAYAELKGGHYQQAARNLAKFSASDDFYNRGNALARSGRLQDAIKAYDAALRRNPDNRDAKHNRDLVKKALQEQQKQNKPTAGNNSSTGKTGNSKKPDTGNNTQKKSGAAQNQPGKSQKYKTGQDKAARGRQDNGNASQAHNPGKQGQQPVHAKPAGQANTNGQPADDAAQARRDAAAALNRLPATKHQDKTARAEYPANEQQLSQQQWLRQIPDDPGGLLRRKFMIEHMIRQQEGQQ